MNFYPTTPKQRNCINNSKKQYSARRWSLSVIDLTRNAATQNLGSLTTRSQ
jgi:hypothetical protein